MADKLEVYTKSTKAWFKHPEEGYVVATLAERKVDEKGVSLKFTLDSDGSVRAFSPRNRLSPIAPSRSSTSRPQRSSSPPTMKICRPSRIRRDWCVAGAGYSAFVECCAAAAQPLPFLDWTRTQATY